MRSLSKRSYGGLLVILAVVLVMAAVGLASAAEPVNVIVNGDFELPWEDNSGVAPHWSPYTNGHAHVGWYEETWPEAVHSGERAQLMEIFEVDPGQQSRVIAIYQTVDVAPNSTYDLKFYAIMRSMVQPGDRNKGEFEMHWGVDYSGQGDYENVQTWHLIPLEEQNRLGSTGEYPDDKPLFYEEVTGTIDTGNSSRITLFIRGLKKFATPPEVNFDVDDVTLVGPPPGSSGDMVEAAMPDTGAVFLGRVSTGTAVMGGIVLVVIGLAAASAVVRLRAR